MGSFKDYPPEAVRFFSDQDAGMPTVQRLWQRALISGGLPQSFTKHLIVLLSCKQLSPKGESFMVSGELPPACSLQYTLYYLKIVQTCRDCDLHSSRCAAGFHKNIETGVFYEHQDNHMRSILDYCKLD